ncbi:MAG: hypothetical protein AAB834_03245, partial [Patescibacteria group bacterium]
TIKSDDVYGRSKAYESIIKKTAIVGPKVPESFNVLVKELQGLGLKVDLVDSGKVVDAESVLATNIRDEAEHQSELDVPVPLVSEVDVTEDAAVDEFMVMENMSEDLVSGAATIQDDDDDIVDEETKEVA